MKDSNVKDLTEEQFSRLRGVKRSTFDKMVSIVREKHEEKKMKGGRKNKLSVESMLLMSLEYLREYRTYFHISQSYGISESNAYKIIKWVEGTLIKAPDFVLPGRKAIVKSDSGYEVILVDATETGIERPKKSKRDTILERKSAIR